jgi:phosphatidylinositol glycan class P protein
MWIMTALGCFGYQFWAFVPEHIIRSLGIHYIPNKYMAVAIPAWLAITVWCVIMLYLSHSMMHTHPRHSYFTMQDRHSALAHPHLIDPPPTNLNKAPVKIARELKLIKQSSYQKNIGGPHSAKHLREDDS